MAARLSHVELLSLDSRGLQKKLEAGLITSVELVQACLSQIHRHEQRGAKLNAMISIVPTHHLLERSAYLDSERKAGCVRSDFHGIPILIKDAIATGPSLHVATTLGNLAFKDFVAAKSATIVAKLEDMGAVVIGKTNLNEFCNFKGDANSNGWSAVGGQTQSAYISRRPNETGLGQSDPCGSSTGSAVGVSAGYAPLALGTESIGSIVMPASRAGLYAFKPALDTVNMDGILRTSVNLDVVGGLARSTANVALLSQIALTDEKCKDLPDGGFRSFLTQRFDSLRVGFLDPEKWSLHPSIVRLEQTILKQMNEMYFASIERIKDHISQANDAKVVYPVDLPPATDMWYQGQNPIDVINSYDGTKALEDWLLNAEIPGFATIEDIIEFNENHKDEELPNDHPDQNQLLNSSRNPPSKATYDAVKTLMKEIARDGIDRLLHEQNLNILVFPMDSLMAFYSAGSGYPIATMPVGTLNFDGRPYGIGIMAQAGAEDLMFQFMSAFEATFPVRPLPSRVPFI